MKRLAAFAAATILIVALVSTGTLAYFTAQGKADNVITSGSIRMKLHDEMADGALFPSEGVHGIVPGDSIDKCVYVENVGGNPLYARVKLERIMTLNSGENTMSLEGIVLDINQRDWTYNKEQDYYYYNRALKPGEKASPLFTKVIFSTELGNEYQNARLEISVSAQAVQSQNNTDSPLSAGGWPKQ